MYGMSASTDGAGLMNILTGTGDPDLQRCSVNCRKRFSQKVRRLFVYENEWYPGVAEKCKEEEAAIQ